MFSIRFRRLVRPHGRPCVRNFAFTSLFILPCLIPCSAPAAPPNIVIILADDMGYADIAPYGGEIRTPNLDRLAAGGVKFTHFYNTGRCCPTRAALLTGLYSHQAGVGGMNQDESATSGPGYMGSLNASCVTLAEVLKPAGYSTYMAGKWHVASTYQIQHKEAGGWPLQRGFDRYFGILDGASPYFKTGSLINDDKPVAAPAGSYLTQLLSDSATAFINRHAATRANPFFLYLAYTCPHTPLQALKEDIDKYRTRYLKGWDTLRAERYARQLASGLINPAWKLSPADGAKWDTLSPARRDEMALRMAIYSAQVDRMDQGIGQVMAALDAKGLTDNTLILFLSDNGGNLEGGLLGWGTAADLEMNNTMTLSYGQSWANASNTPFRWFKHYVHEGGISTPLIARWPAGVSRKGVWEPTPAHLIDIMPTLVELAGAAYPAQRAGKPVLPMQGVSLAPLLRGGSIVRKAPLFWEHEGHKAVRDGKWKLVSSGGAWELYDMDKDRTELNNLAKTDPARVKSMDSLWQHWAETSNVIRKPVSTAMGPDLPAPAPAPSRPRKDALGRPAVKARLGFD
jgi:arylsulfatase A-like enzyme